MAALNDALTRWQNIAIERAVKLELANVEVEQATARGNPESITIADRYRHQAKRMLDSAMRKIEELTANDMGCAA